MAFYIPIRKETEDDLIATYSYGVETSFPLPSSDTRPRYNYGRIAIEKASGSINLVEPAVGDESQRYFERAAQKIFLHWKAGALPNETCWAS
jgi:hypothetical protein